MTRRARVAAWLARRLASYADPSQLHAADRDRLERLSGRTLGPSVPCDAPIPYWLETPTWHELAWEARFVEVLNAPESDVEEAFLVMVTGFFAEDDGRRWLEEQ